MYLHRRQDKSVVLGTDLIPTPLEGSPRRYNQVWANTAISNWQMLIHCMWATTSMSPTSCYSKESVFGLLQCCLLVVHNSLHSCKSNRAPSSFKTTASRPRPSRDDSGSPLFTQKYDAPLESYLKILFQPRNLLSSTVALPGTLSRNTTSRSTIGSRANRHGCKGPGLTLTTILLSRALPAIVFLVKSVAIPLLSLLSEIDWGD